jgi:hypothetical protein
MVAALFAALTFVCRRRPAIWARSRNSYSNEWDGMAGSSPAFSATNARKGQKIVATVGEHRFSSRQKQR